MLVWGICLHHTDLTNLIAKKKFSKILFIHEGNVSEITVKECVYFTFSYNWCLAQTRAIVECTLGQWKRKFACLKKRLEYKTEKVSTIIKACAFLWNFGILCGDNKGFNPSDYVIEDLDDFQTDLNGTAGVNAQRDLLYEYLWVHR